ncbi:MAG: DUF2092 domain-containing protein [Proteobacteria bacterium]|nr:DUF2092 domain-containing protein [Pseudomonadota bacterium]
MPKAMRPAVLAAVLAVAVAAGAAAQTSPSAAPPAASPETAPRPPKPPQLDLGLKFGLEPKALEILKAASDKLSAATSMSFDAVATYESPARTGQPLAYLSEYQVLLKRPNKLRVISPGDGPPSEFYYDGKTVMAYAPKENLVAVAEAPPTIDEMLKAAYDVAAIYFPFTDLIVADPYKVLSGQMKVAFYMGQSRIVGGTTTDIVVVANDAVQAQIWIGAADHLPRMVRATYFDEPGNYRHLVVFRNWKLDAAAPPGAFTSARAAKAPRMRFGAPPDTLPHFPSPQQGAPQGQQQGQKP